CYVYGCLLTDARGESSQRRPHHDDRCPTELRYLSTDPLCHANSPQYSPWRPDLCVAHGNGRCSLAARLRSRLRPTELSFACAHHWCGLVGTCLSSGDATEGWQGWPHPPWFRLSAA